MEHVFVMERVELDMLDVFVYPLCPLSLCDPASFLFILLNSDELRNEAVLKR